MTIPNTVTAHHPITRTEAATATSELIRAERKAVAEALKAEIAAYATSLDEPGGFSDTLRDWLVSDVLPSIRKTGGYLIDESFRSSARSIANDDRGVMMLPILAAISEQGRAPLDAPDTKIGRCAPPVLDI